VVNTLVTHDELLRAAATAALEGKLVGFVSHRETLNGFAVKAVADLIGIENCARITNSVSRRSIETVSGGRIHFLHASMTGGRGLSVELLCLQGANHFSEDVMSSLIWTTTAHSAPILETEEP